MISLLAYKTTLSYRMSATLWDVLNSLTTEIQYAHYFTELLNSMITLDPRDRPSTNQILHTLRTIEPHLSPKDNLPTEIERTKDLEIITTAPWVPPSRFSEAAPLNQTPPTPEKPDPIVQGNTPPLSAIGNCQCGITDARILNDVWQSIQPFASATAQWADGVFKTNRRGWLASIHSYPRGVRVEGRVRFLSSGSQRVAILLRCPLNNRKRRTHNVHHGINCWIRNDGNIRLSPHELSIKNATHSIYLKVGDFYDFWVEDTSPFEPIVFRVRSSADNNIVTLTQQFLVDEPKERKRCYHVVINSLETSSVLVEVSNIKLY